jgi:hypothetical protein
LSGLVLATEDFDDQCCRFALTVDDFRKSTACSSIQIDISRLVFSPHNIRRCAQESLEHVRSGCTLTLIWNEFTQSVQDVRVRFQFSVFQSAGQPVPDDGV